MKKLMAVSVLAATFASAATPAYAQQVPPAAVAVVDFRRVYTECTACRAAEAQLQAQRQQIRQHAAQLNRALQTEDRAIRQARGGQSALTPALQQRVQALRAQRQSGQRDINSREQAFRRNAAYVRQQIDQRLRPIVQQVMQQRGANLVVSRQSAFAAAPALDITTAVLSALNQQLPSVAVNAPAAQQRPR